MIDLFLLAGDLTLYLGFIDNDSFCFLPFRAYSFQILYSRDSNIIFSF